MSYIVKIAKIFCMFVMCSVSAPRYYWPSGGEIDVPKGQNVRDVVCEQNPEIKPHHVVVTPIIEEKNQVTISNLDGEMREMLDKFDITRQRNDDFCTTISLHHGARTLQIELVHAFLPQWIVNRVTLPGGNEKELAFMVLSPGLPAGMYFSIKLVCSNILLKSTRAIQPWMVIEIFASFLEGRFSTYNLCNEFPLKMQGKPDTSGTNNPDFLTIESGMFGTSGIVGTQYYQLPDIGLPFKF